MSSFGEIVVSFSFLDSAPPEIVAAFSRWRIPGERDADAPRLPEHVDDVTAGVERILDGLPDYTSYPPKPGDLNERISELEADVSALTVAERATLWSRIFEGTSPYYFPIGTSIQMRWRNGWKLAARFHLQESPEVICGLVAPLGAYARSSDKRDLLCGYVWFERHPAPVLIWAQGEGSFVFEDLRPPEFWV